MSKEQMIRSNAMKIVGVEQKSNMEKDLKWVAGAISAFVFELLIIEFFEYNIFINPSTIQSVIMLISCLFLAWLSKSRLNRTTKIITAIALVGIKVCGYFAFTGAAASLEETKNLFITFKQCMDRAMWLRDMDMYEVQSVVAISTFALPTLIAVITPIHILLEKFGKGLVFNTIVTSIILFLSISSRPSEPSLKLIILAILSVVLNIIVVQSIRQTNDMKARQIKIRGDATFTRAIALLIVFAICFVTITTAIKPENYDLDVKYADFKEKIQSGLKTGGGSETGIATEVVDVGRVLSGGTVAFDDAIIFYVLREAERQAVPMYLRSWSAMEYTDSRWTEMSNEHVQYIRNGLDGASDWTQITRNWLVEYQEIYSAPVRYISIIVNNEVPDIERYLMPDAYYAIESICDTHYDFYPRYVSESGVNIKQNHMTTLFISDETKNELINRVGAVIYEDVDGYTEASAEFLRYSGLLNTTMSRYTESIPESIKALAYELCPDDENVSTTVKIGLVKRYLSENITYSTRVPVEIPKGADFAENFLFESKIGYCAHYATAATLLLRAMGVTARYAEGYYIAPEELEGKDEVPVKAAYAHAWVEVWSDVGWVPVEVTNTYLQDSLYGSMDFSETEQPIETLRPTPSATITPTTPPPSSSSGSDSEDIKDDTHEPEGETKQVPVGLIVGISSAIAVVAVVIIIRALIRNKRRRILCANDKSAALAMMKEVFGHLRVMKVRVQKTITEKELLSQLKKHGLSDDMINAIICVYATAAKARFSNSEMTADELQTSRNSLIIIRKGICSLGMRGKLHCIINLCLTKRDLHDI